MSNLPILFYLIGVLVVGLAASSRKDRSAEEYFYGGKSIGSVAFGSSLILSNILRYQIVLLPLVVLGSFWVAVALSVFVVALSYLFGDKEPLVDNVPAACGNGAGRLLISGLIFLSYVTVQIAAILALSNLILRDVLNLDYSTSALLLIVFAGIYAIVGGYSAVAHTQTLQLVVVLTGLIALVLMKGLPAPIVLIQNSSSAQEFSTGGMLLGLPIVSLWIWHYDRLTLNHSRAPKNALTMRTGLFLAGVAACVLSLGAMLFASGPGSSPGGPAHQVLLLICFSILMAAFASLFAGTAELTSNEFFARMKPSASDQEVVLVGRLATAAVAGVTIILIPLAQTHSAGFLAMFLVVQVSFFPPITALYTAKMLLKSIPPAGVLPALILGELLGILRLVFHSSIPEVISSNPALSWFVSMDDFLFAFCLFGFSLVVLYGAGAIAGIRLRPADRLTS